MQVVDNRTVIQDIFGQIGAVHLNSTDSTCLCHYLSCFTNKNGGISSIFVTAVVGRGLFHKLTSGRGGFFFYPSFLARLSSIAILWSLAGSQ